MRVSLIIPSSGFLIDERVFPSLGVLKVAASLEQAGHEAHILDLSGLKATTPEKASFDFVKRTKPDVIGITATMPQMPEAARIAMSFPFTKLVLGGPHPTLLQASARKGVPRAIESIKRLNYLFDVVVAGDGEKAIIEAIKPETMGLIDADDVKSPLYMQPDDLDKAPWPARHLIDLPSYRYRIDNVPTMSMIAQLGCPFGCVFCGGRSSPFLRKVRMRSTASVVAEMEHLYLEYGNRGFMFLDDELNVNKGFIELLFEIIKLQRKHGVEFRLRGLLKSELVTEQMADLMYQAGFRQVLIGFESGDDEILKTIQKKATVKDNTQCVKRLKQFGIKVKALMSFGHAGESLWSMERTENWLLKVEPDDFDVTIITVYPGTPYYDDAVPHSTGMWKYTSPVTGAKLYMADMDQFKDTPFYKGRPSAYQAYVYTDDVTATQLRIGRDNVERNVREKLGIPYPTSVAEQNYEHSMGMH